jgi:hypothetical protein
MKKTALALLALAALAAAACRDPQPQASPDYNATRRDSRKAQNGLDNADGN